MGELSPRGFTDYLSVSTFSRFKAKSHSEMKAKVIPALLQEFAARLHRKGTKHSGVFNEGENLRKGREPKRSQEYHGLLTPVRQEWQWRTNMLGQKAPEES